MTQRFLADGRTLHLRAVDTALLTMLAIIGWAYAASAQPTSGPTTEPSGDAQSIEMIRTAVERSLAAGVHGDLVFLHELPLERVVAALGEPTDLVVFPMANCCDEFRIELYNTYPPDDPTTQDREIRELTWDFGYYRLTVWGHQPGEAWVVLESAMYTEDTEF